MKPTLEKMFTSLEDSKGSGECRDLTSAFQVMITCKDRTVTNVEIVADESNDSAVIHMHLGLRSSILDEFAKQYNDSNGNFQTSDIFGLVPAVALMVSNSDHHLEGAAINRIHDLTRLLLTFAARSDEKGTWQDKLSRSVDRFFRRWDSWTNIMERTLSRDPFVGDWRVDWREFLAGEAGFYLMPWFPTMTLNERWLALERITIVAKALLLSALTPQELDESIVCSLIEWLDTLAPIPDVISYKSAASEGIV